MNKSFNIMSIFMCVAFLLVYSIPVSATGVQNNELEGFTLIYLFDISENINVYENNDTGEKCAIFNPEDFEIGEEIVLYIDEETGDKVQLTITPQEASVSLCDSYDSGWSAGNMPAGSYTCNPEIDSSTFYLKYSVDVTLYPVRMLDAYNTYYHAVLANITSYETEVVNSSATSSSPARATCQFMGNVEEYGIIVGSFSGYLTFQVNQSGQIRVTWYW